MGEGGRGGGGRDTRSLHRGLKGVLGWLGGVTGHRMRLLHNGSRHTKQESKHTSSDGIIIIIKRGTTRGGSQGQGRLVPALWAPEISGRVAI